MDRAEHLQWAKDRALAELDAGSTANAVASMASDLGKHQELEGHPGINLGMMQVAGGFMTTPEQYRKWIEGFN